MKRISVFLTTIALIAGMMGCVQVEYVPMITAGFAHMVGLKSDGTVVAVGDDLFGVCDVGEWSGIILVDADYRNTVGLKADGTVVAVGWNSEGQCDVDDWRDIIQVAAGWQYTVGLKADGTVVTVGWNYYGVRDAIWNLVVAVPTVNWPLIGGIISAVVVGLVIFFVRRNRQARHS